MRIESYVQRCWLVSSSDTQEHVDRNAAAYLPGAVNLGMKVGDLVHVRSTRDGSVSTRSVLFLTSSGAATLSRVNPARAVSVLAGALCADFDPAGTEGPPVRELGAWVVRVRSGASEAATVTGIAGGVDGLVLLVSNGGPALPVAFVAQASHSQPHNRLASGFTLAPGASTLIAYARDRWTIPPSIE